ncbi:hypothetical protein E4T47_05651 [Aureobasidium subglaciale]|nr:hypothetical protein E4T47_05651 [Aureobasidium subglaciale]
MAVTQDPNFWKRFSYAIHQDEEAQVSNEKNPWLTSTRQKRKHAYLRICCTFWILLFSLIAIIVVVILILVKTHALEKIHIGGGDKNQGKEFNDWLQRLFKTGDEAKGEGS